MSHKSSGTWRGPGFWATINFNGLNDFLHKTTTPIEPTFWYLNFYKIGGGLIYNVPTYARKYVHIIILHISENHDNIATVEEENDWMVVFTRTKITVITNGSRERQFHSQKCASNNIFRGFPNSFQEQAKISLCKVINFLKKFPIFSFLPTNKVSWRKMWKCFALMHFSIY